MTARKQAPTALVPSDVSAWGDEPDQREHELPSGRVMTLRRGPSMKRLILQGVVPSSLLDIQLIERPADEAEEPQGVLRTYEVNSKLFEQHRAAVVCAMTVQPAVVMEPLDGALLYDLLDEIEIEYIVAWAREGLAGTATFLVDAGGDADGEGGEGVGEVPE